MALADGLLVATGDNRGSGTPTHTRESRYDEEAHAGRNHGAMVTDRA